MEGTASTEWYQKSPDAAAQARAEAAPELGGLKGAAPRLLHFARSTPLVACTLVGHKQAVRARGLPESMRVSNRRP